MKSSSSTSYLLHHLPLAWQEWHRTKHHGHGLSHGQNSLPSPASQGDKTHVEIEKDLPPQREGPKFQYEMLCGFCLELVFVLFGINFWRSFQKVDGEWTVGFFLQQIMAEVGYRCHCYWLSRDAFGKLSTVTGRKTWVTGKMVLRLRNLPKWPIWGMVRHDEWIPNESWKYSTHPLLSTLVLRRAL